MAFRKLSDCDYTLIKRLGVLGSRKSDETDIEVTLGKWNSDLRLDIRKWHTPLELGTGISLTEEEVRALRRILDETDFAR